MPIFGGDANKNKTLSHISDQEVSNIWCPITKIDRLETTTAKNLKYIKHPCLGKSDRVLTAGTLEM